MGPTRTRGRVWGSRRRPKRGPHEVKMGKGRVTGTATGKKKKEGRAKEEKGSCVVPHALVHTHNKYRVL
jgi:hypothetical protein